MHNWCIAQGILQGKIQTLFISDVQTLQKPRNFSRESPDIRIYMNSCFFIFEALEVYAIVAGISYSKLKSF